jgi:TfoX N-terminal domain
MFGGVGFLVNGNMLVGVWKDSLIARLGPEQGDEALLEPNVKEFDITGKAMKNWILVEPEGVVEETTPTRLEPFAGNWLGRSGETMPFPLPYARGLRGGT